MPLTEPLPPGGRAVIQMDFQVAVPSELGGGYGLFGYLNGILALDGFYPAIPVYDATRLARRAGAAQLGHDLSGRQLLRGASHGA